MPRATLAKVNGRIVLALTANPLYTLDGVREGTRLTAAARQLKLGKRLQLGAPTTGTSPWQDEQRRLKIRHGIVQEVGIANRQLTTNRAAQIRLLRNF